MERSAETTAAHFVARTPPNLRLHTHHRHPPPFVGCQVVCIVEAPVCLLYGITIFLGQYGPLDMVPLMLLNVR